MQLFKKITYKPKHGEQTALAKSVNRIIVPSLIAVCVCALCLCGITFAWFSASNSAETKTIQSSSYVISCQPSSAQDATELNFTSNAFSMASDAETFTLTATGGEGTTGYCSIRIANKTYYTEQIVTGASFEFTVKAPINTEVLLTPSWGTCEERTDENKVVNSGEIDLSAANANEYEQIKTNEKIAISAANGGSVSGNNAEIRIPSNAVEQDIEAVFSIELTESDATSLTFDISLKDGNGNTITLKQPATITLDIGQDLNIASVLHGSEALTEYASADALQDQGYYYNSTEGKLYICTSTFSPFKVVLVQSAKIVDKVNDAIYLSDVPYNTEMTVPASATEAYGVITMDKTANGGDALNLIVNGENVTFKKGIFAHAESTVVYDLSQYECDYFSTYYGISSLRGTKGNVKFYIYTSNDGQNWELKTSETPNELTAASNAEYVKIPISGVKYLKLFADDNNGNGNDHAIYADAKIFKEGYAESLMPAVTEYNEQILTACSSLTEGGTIEVTEDVEFLLLQRELVKNAGQYTLKTFAEESAMNKKVLNMLLSDREMLKLYLAGGKPEGSYLKSLEVLSKLYEAHGSDLDITLTTQYGTKLGDLYRTMMLAISLTHSGNVYLWVDGSAVSDPVTRYEIYKDLHSEGLIEVETFESLTVEEMRWVMNTVIDDEEIKWLNNYVRTVKNGATGPYSYIKYTFGYNYTLEKYYSAENYDTWNEKYGLSDWDVPYESGHPKLWIVFEEGAVCGGLSKTGSCIWGSYKGLPNTCVSQPAHCAYIYYTQVNGNGVWGLGNNVSGWAKSGKTEHLGVRMMNDWGSSVSGWSASYILLAQAAQNEYDKYEEAEVLMMLADVYNDKGNTQMQEKIYRKILEVESFNYDAWSALVNLYLNDTTKTEAEYMDLAEEVASALTYYPKPMYDLISKIEPKLTSSGTQASFTMLRTRTLTAAANATDAQTIQKDAVVAVAKQLLGTTDGTIAEFSFDGEDGGKIVLGSQFDGSDVTWDYSLDGGTTWKQTTDNKHALTQAEIDAITVENDIKVHIIGVDYSEDNIYTIDIKESAGLPSTLYANDLEDKMIATTNAMEWRFSENDAWTSFASAQPDLSGNKTLIVRVGATGVRLASASKTYEFTADDLPDTRKYVSISKLSVVDFSSETNAKTDNYKRSWEAVNAIDGNANTMWHTNAKIVDAEKYITIKLDEPMYISALEYQPAKIYNGSNYQYGIMKNAIVYVSSDGESWEQAASVTDSPKTYTAKLIKFDKVQLVQYVKFQMTCSHESGNKFANAAMINLYYDSTAKKAESSTSEGSAGSGGSSSNSSAGSSGSASLSGSSTNSSKDESSKESGSTNNDTSSDLSIDAKKDGEE